MCARGEKGDVQLLPSVSVPKLSCPMPRTVRVAPAGVIFHVLNRANARARIFEKDLDYEAFNRVIAETANLVPVEIFAYTIMPTHWHGLEADERGRSRKTTLYHGTYKSFPKPAQRSRILLSIESHISSQI